MLAAGSGGPGLAALNAALGRVIGSPAAAALLLFAVAFCICVGAVLITGTQPLTKLAQAPKHLFLGGVFVAFYVLSITYVAPSFGVGNAVFFVLLGQLISSAIIDHFGLFMAQPTPINWTRFAGIMVMAIGVMITQRA
jgi:transporter family-2 protein